MDKEPGNSISARDTTRLSLYMLLSRKLSLSFFLFGLINNGL